MSRPPSRLLRSERGTATLVAAFGAMALIAVCVMALEVGAATLARHRAEWAADAGALAGAGAVLTGEAAACDAAGAAVVANGARVTNCAVDGADVLVTVTVRVRIGPARREAAGRARAGPVAAQAP